MKKHKHLLIALCTLAALALPAAAQDGPFLTSKTSTADPLEIALDYIGQIPQKGLMSADDFADMKVQDRYTSKQSGITHIYFKQRLGGLEVANGRISINVHRDGRVINMGNSFVANLKAAANTRTPELGAGDAIRAAADKLGLEVPGLLVPLKSVGGPAQEMIFSPAGLSLEQIPTKLVYWALEDGSVRLAWDMVIQTADHQHHYNLFVDAVTGEVLGKVDWMAWDQYEVFALPKESPSDGGRTIEANPANGTASPFGWHDTDGVAGAEFTTTRGNNVCAQQDRDGNNTACGGVAQPDGGASLDFTGAVVPLDLNQEPTTYQDAAVVNLFYWNNVMHDLLYQYGFDEASGNFQENNYGKGGLDSDSVNADAQDNAGGNPPSTNNANFSTPPEPNGPFSTNPRMQMFEWTPPNTGEVVVDSGTAAGTYTASEAAFGPALDTTGVSATLVEAFDGSGSTTDACEAITNGGTVSGNIALVDRGSCSFVTKVRNAQNAGAVGVIVANNVAGSPITMGDDGTGGDITIPSVMVSQSDGATIRGGTPAPGTIRATPNPPPNRDSDLDAGIIAHEYGHGLSIRLTGGPADSGCLSGNQQAGEGWSDLLTLFFTADAADTGTTARGVGSYVLYEPATGAGIRDFPYSTDLAVNPQTYGDLVNAGQPGGPSIPHGVGTVWATAVWEVYWNLVNKHGFDSDLYNGTGGNNLAIQLVVDGLKLQPCNPTFLDARDAILLADANNNGGANECEIWAGFAKRGMGASANDGGGSSSTNVTEAFDLPPQCVTGCGNGICEAGEDCNTCPSDCVGGTSGAVCGNGLCEAGDGETCVTCPADCNGRTGGKPANRFCCGFGDGLSPEGCGDSRCTSSGFSCTETPVPGGSFCCGLNGCEAGESCSNCALDCTIGVEVCTGGIDEDCDGAVDCADSECTNDPNCQQVDCSQFTNKSTCNAQTGCRWNNKDKVCVPQ